MSKSLKTPSIGASLAAATAALLGQSAPTPVVAQDLTPWKFDTSALYYAESGGRVKDYSVEATARKEVREDNFLDINFSVDSLTGASPSGAVPTAELHTFTSASGRLVTVAAGDLPLDSSFIDKRVALSTNYELPVTRLTLFNMGLSKSHEYDYDHSGVNMKLARDLNQRNTTLSFGMAVANDTVSPIGGTHVPLSVVTGSTTEDNLLGNQSKDVKDLLLGVTQVVSRQTIVQFNYGVTKSDGYLNDPYKILSVVDPVFGNPIPPPVGVDQDHLYLYENRPNSREQKSLYSMVKRDIEGDVFDVSFRYMTDDWDVKSQTFDMHYRWNYTRSKYTQIHLRYYSQSAASFYQTVLFNGQPLPTYATADYRLGDFHAFTIGLEFGKYLDSGEVSGRVELYHQTGKASPGSEVGTLRLADLNPGFNAIIGQLSYKFGG